MNEKRNVFQKFIYFLWLFMTAIKQQNIFSATETENRLFKNVLLLYPIAT